MKSVKVSVRLTNEENEKLKQIAIKNNCSKAVIMREAINKLSIDRTDIADNHYRKKQLAVHFIELTNAINNMESDAGNKLKEIVGKIQCQIL